MTNTVLLSLQVGLPAQHGADSVSKKSWESGIFKYPVNERVWLDKLNLVGDGQKDLKNHGGPFRAVLAYGAVHYPIWRAELGLDDLPYGAFGENFTVSDLTEETVCLGDVYAVGEARLQVTQPRQPCWKLARRWGIRDLAARVGEKEWGGWYHRVLQTGYVGTGDAYELLERPYPNYPISLLNDLITEKRRDRAACAGLAEVEALTPSWRGYFAELASFYG